MKPRKYVGLGSGELVLIWMTLLIVGILSLLFIAYLVYEYDLPIEDFLNKIVIDKSIEILVTVSAALVAIGYTLNYFIVDKLFNEYPSKFIEKYIMREKLTGPYKGLIAILTISLFATLFENHIGQQNVAILIITIASMFIFMIYWFTNVHKEMFEFMNVPKTIERTSSEISDYIDKNNNEQFKINMNELNDIVLSCILNEKIEYSKIGINNITKTIVGIIGLGKMELLNEYKFIDRLKEMFIESLKLNETKTSMLIINNMIEIGNNFIESDNILLLNEYKFIDKLKGIFIESLKTYESKATLHILDEMMVIMHKFINYDISLLYDDEYMDKLKEMYIESLKNDDSDVALNVIKNFVDLINKVHNDVIKSFPDQDESTNPLLSEFNYVGIEKLYYKKLEESYEKMFIASLQSEDVTIINDLIKSNMNIMEILAGRESFDIYSDYDTFDNFEYAINSVGRQLFKLLMISIDNNAIIIFKSILENFHQRNFIHSYIDDIGSTFGYRYKFSGIGNLLSDDIINDLNFKLEFNCIYNFKEMNNIYNTVNNLKQKINKDDDMGLYSLLNYTKNSLMELYFSNLLHVLFFELGASLFDRRYVGYVDILWNSTSFHESPITWLTFYLFGTGYVNVHDDFEFPMDHSLQYRLDYYSLLMLKAGHVFSYAPLKDLEFKRSHLILKFLSDYNITEIQESFNKLKNSPYVNNLNNNLNNREDKTKSIDSSLKSLHKQRLNYEIGIISKFKITNVIIDKFLEYLKSNYTKNWRIKHIANFEYKNLPNTSRFIIHTEYVLSKVILFDLSFYENTEKYMLEYDVLNTFHSKHSNNELLKIYNAIVDKVDVVSITPGIDIYKYLESTIKSLKLNGIKPNTIFLTDNEYIKLDMQKKIDHARNLITIDNTQLSLVSSIFYSNHKINFSARYGHLFDNIVIFDKNALQITYKIKNINDRLKITHTTPNKSSKDLSVKFTVKSHMQVKILDTKKFVILNDPSYDRITHKLQ